MSKINIIIWDLYTPVSFLSQGRWKMMSYQEESQPLCRQKGGGMEVAEDSYGTLPKINTNIIEGKIHTRLLGNEELGL